MPAPQHLTLEQQAARRGNGQFGHVQKGAPTSSLSLPSRATFVSDQPTPAGVGDGHAAHSPEALDHPLLLTAWPPASTRVFSDEEFEVRMGAMDFAVGHCLEKGHMTRGVIGAPARTRMHADFQQAIDHGRDGFARGMFDGLRELTGRHHGPDAVNFVDHLTLLGQKRTNAQDRQRWAESLQLVPEDVPEAEARDYNVGKAYLGVLTEVGHHRGAVISHIAALHYDAYTAKADAQ